MRSDDRRVRLHRWSDDIETQRKLRLERIEIKRGWPEEPGLLPEDDRVNMFIAMGFYAILMSLFVAFFVVVI